MMCDWQSTWQQAVCSENVLRQHAHQSPSLDSLQVAFCCMMCMILPPGIEEEEEEEEDVTQKEAELDIFVS
jgi:hypothetical protein